MGGRGAEAGEFDAPSGSPSSGAGSAATPGRHPLFCFLDDRSEELADLSRGATREVAGPSGKNPRVTAGFRANRLRGARRFAVNTAGNHRERAHRAVDDHSTPMPSALERLRSTPQRRHHSEQKSETSLTRNSPTKRDVMEPPLQGKWLTGTSRYARFAS